MTAPIVISGRVLGVEQIVRRFSVAPVGLAERMRVAMRVMGTKIENTAKRDKLTGQVLHVRSGRLRRSVNTQYSDDGTTFTASTGSNVSYGAAWELGWDRVANVHAFVRRQKSRNTRGATGGLTKSGKPKAGVVSSGIAFVSAHQRHTQQAARPWLRPSLEANRAEARRRLTLAIQGI